MTNDLSSFRSQKEEERKAIFSSWENWQLGINKEMRKSSTDPGGSPGQRGNISLVSKASYKQVLRVSGDETYRIQPPNISGQYSHNTDGMGK